MIPILMKIAPIDTPMRALVQTFTQVLDLRSGYPQKWDLNACTRKKEIIAVLRQMDCDSTFSFQEQA